MARPAPKFELSEDELFELQKLSKARKTPQQTVVRINILLALHNKKPLTHYAKEQNLSTRTIRLWRNKWLATSETGLSSLQRLEDEYRSGAPSKFSEEQWCQIMAIALEKPEESQRSISHWTARELRDEAVKRKVIESMGITTMLEFFKRDCFQTA
jgi:putative transposase